MSDKVKYSVRKVHYAMFKENSETDYEIPVAIPGAVALSLEPKGEVSPFHADGILYFNATSNNGYEGDLEVAYFPPQFLKDVFGYKEDPNSKVLTEYADAQPKPFALLCEEEGDSEGTKFAFYKCTATRPSRSLNTKTETISPNTQKIAVTMTPALDGSVFGMTQADTPKDVRDGWYTSVHKVAAAE